VPAREARPRAVPSYLEVEDFMPTPRRSLIVVLLIAILGASFAWMAADPRPATAQG